MEKVKALRIIVALVSTIIFCYQSSTAFDRLSNPPAIDVTEVLNITDIDPPLILVCPYGQINTAKSGKLGYEFYDNFFLGKITNITNMTSWGAHLNMTYPELVAAVLNLGLLREFRFTKSQSGVYSTHLDYKEVLYPKYGHCLQLYGFDVLGKIAISASTNGYLKSWDLLVTDKKRNRYYTFDIESHLGDKILISGNVEAKFKIKIRLHSLVDPWNEASCDFYEKRSYADCVDEQIQKMMIPKVNCSPPWLSPNNPCQVLNHSTASVIREDVELFQQQVFNMEEIFPERNCKKPCLKLNAHVQTVYENIRMYNRQDIQLTFDPEVIYTRKMLTYGFYDFLVDIGGSLGLWLGLSVYGLIDLTVEFLVYLKDQGRSCFI